MVNDRTPVEFIGAKSGKMTLIARQYSMPGYLVFSDSRRKKPTFFWGCVDTKRVCIILPIKKRGHAGKDRTKNDYAYTEVDVFCYGV